MIHTLCLHLLTLPDPPPDALKTPFTGVKASAITLILFREQLNIKGVVVAFGVELTSGMEFVCKRAENRRPVLGFGCYASKEKATNRDTSALDGNWRDPVRALPRCGRVRMQENNLYRLLLPAHIYKRCVPRWPTDPSCQTLKAEASEARASFSDMHCTFPVTGPWGPALLFFLEVFSDLTGRCVTS